MLIVGYSRAVSAPPSGLDVVQAWTSSSNTIVSSVPLVMPATITAGNTLVAASRINHTVLDTSRKIASPLPAGWTMVAKLDDADDTTYPGFYIFRKTADGTEGGTTVNFPLTGGMKSTVIAWEISGNRLVEATMAAADDNPPPHTPSGGSMETVWLAIWGARYSKNAVTGVPSGYGIADLRQAVTTDNSTSATDNRIAGVHRVGTASSEDPGAFTFEADAQALLPQSATVSAR